MMYKCSSPYPTPHVECKNKDYAYILMQDYASKSSEFTAISLYSFQHLCKFDTNEEFSNAIEQISIVEMIHFELLGKTINLLGVTPKIMYGNIYWNSGFVNYTTDLKQMLKFNIKAEENAIEQYKCHCKMINDIYIKNLLKRIIKDEHIHIQVFEELLKKYC